MHHFVRGIDLELDLLPTPRTYFIERRPHQTRIPQGTPQVGVQIGVAETPERPVDPATQDAAPDPSLEVEDEREEIAVPAPLVGLGHLAEIVFLALGGRAPPDLGERHVEERQDRILGPDEPDQSLVILARTVAPLTSTAVRTIYSRVHLRL